MYYSPMHSGRNTDLTKIDAARAAIILDVNTRDGICSFDDDDLTRILDSFHGGWDKWELDEIVDVVATTYLAELQKLDGEDR